MQWGGARRRGVCFRILSLLAPYSGRSKRLLQSRRSDEDEADEDEEIEYKENENDDDNVDDCQNDGDVVAVVVIVAGLLPSLCLFPSSHILGVCFQLRAPDWRRGCMRYYNLNRTEILVEKGDVIDFLKNDTMPYEEVR
eukprot:GHVT01082126.1.p1 GENE.GHVT01082126.1~~GHVT01082126.1.p1  ORF type:complete len:139 (+),score=14.46 GHVT01082126.1:378-794(+)